MFLVRLILRWELEHHALAVIVDDAEGVPSDVHPLGHRLLVVLLVQLLLPAKHLSVHLIEVVSVRALSSHARLVLMQIKTSLPDQNGSWALVLAGFVRELSVLA